VLSIGTKIIDLGWPWTAKTHSVAEKMCLLEPTAQIWMKIDPYYQRQKCRPMILVSGNIRFMGIFEGVLTLGGASNESGVDDDGNFWRFEWLYFFGIFRDKASSIIWRHATPCRPVTDCKIFPALSKIEHCGSLPVPWLLCYLPGNENPQRDGALLVFLDSSHCFAMSQILEWLTVHFHYLVT